jgi:hypothetical protein
VPLAGVFNERQIAGGVAAVLGLPSHDADTFGHLVSVTRYVPTLKGTLA